MTRLETLLTMPLGLAARPPAWQAIVEGDPLFQLLEEARRESDAEDWAYLLELVKPWRKWYAYRSDAAGQEQAAAVARLVWCAGEAARNRERYETGLDVAKLALAELPEPLRGHEEWAWVCIRTFLGRTARTVRVPVSLVEAGGGGSLGELELGLLEQGAGRIVMHPGELFQCRPGDSFARAMTNAFTAARRLLPEGRERLFDGWWRLREGALPVAAIAGGSAGGAAARGWWHVMQNWRPDPGVLVITTIDADGKPGPVVREPVRAKAQAAAASGTLDTVFVCPEDAGAARGALPGEELIRVVEAAPAVGEAPAFFSQRSWLVEETLAYCKGMLDDTGELPKYYPAHLRDGDGFRRIRQRVQVITDREKWDQWRAAEEERRRRAGEDAAPESRAYDPRRGRPEQDEEEGERRGPERASPPPPLDWDEQAGARHPRAVILGDPGFGKTWLLRFDAHHLAASARQSLESRQGDPDELRLPVLLRLSRVADERGPVGRVLVELAGEGRAPGFRSLLERQLQAGRATVLLDAWDEVPSTERGDLFDRVHSFADSYPALQIRSSSRFVGYSGSADRLAKELELLAWEPPQAEAFVRAWFVEGDARAEPFLHLLRENRQVRGLARIPLMLALMCRAYQEGDLDFPTRRSALYERCLRGLLRDWKNEKTHVRITETALKDHLEVLAKVALVLFEREHEQFTEEELGAALTAAREGLRSGHTLHSLDDDSLIQRWQADGVLVSAGDDGPWLFLHRTFHEYLSARALARRPDWLKVAEAHLYWAEWQEVLGLLGGCLDSDRLSAYFDLLLREAKNDLLARPLHVAASACAEAATMLAVEDARRVAETVTSFWDEAAHGRYQVLLPRAEAVLSGVATHPGARNHAALRIRATLTNLDWQVRRDAVVALAALHDRDAVSLLRERLGDPESDVTHAAVDALVTLEGRGASPLLREWLREAEGSSLLATMEALAALGDRESVPFLRDCLTDCDRSVRGTAVYALAVLQDHESLPLLREVLNDDEPEVRTEVVCALSALHDQEALPILRKALADEEDTVRLEAVGALAALQDYEALPLLRERLADGNEFVREAVREALSVLGDGDVLPRLLECLRDDDAYKCGNSDWDLPLARHRDASLRLPDELDHKDSFVREAAVKSVRALRDRSAIPLLRKRLTDRYPHVRKAAVEALAALQDHDSLPLLRECLADRHTGVREAAVNALATLEDHAALPLLHAWLTDPNGDVRLAVVEALATLQGRLALPLIRGRLADQDLGVRLSALTALTRIGWADRIPIPPEGSD